MLFIAVSKGNYFQWTPEYDVVMRSPDRRQIWENIAAALNSLKQPKFRVTASQDRSRSGFTLTSKQKQKLRDEEKASKIE